MSRVLTAYLTAQDVADELPVVASSPWRWVGGKAKLAERIVSLFPADWRARNYHEPFLGGGSMLFYILANGWNGSRVCASDINRDLVGAYVTIRREPELVMALVDRLRTSHCSEQYYDTRQRFNERRGRFSSEVVTATHAADFLYLNKTCFQGLWRTNRSGSNNVPIGKFATTPAMYNRENIMAVSKALGRVELHSRSFEEALSRVYPGDCCYLDPPYIPVSATSNFTAYSDGGFGDTEQVKLADECRRLDELGARFVLSNSYSPRTLELYKDFDITVVEAARSVNSKGSGRGVVKEVVVRNVRRWPK